MKRLRIFLEGTVQGVGFRPFLFRIARDLGVGGYVKNTASGVLLEVEGDEETLDLFLLRLEREKPPLSRIRSRRIEELDPAGFGDFRIEKSEEGSGRGISLLPDTATCDECLRELFDPGDRRFLYPFTNCTLCGPRFTIVRRLPYDRANTTMDVFRMCPDCDREYRDPSGRRFHAQPNACPLCGPRLILYDPEGRVVAEGEKALRVSLELLLKGGIVALKGIGGFHLLCNALDEGSVRRLRELKGREGKPFAVMFRDVAQLRKFADPTEEEITLLTSPQRPIVLVRGRGLAPSVAPRLRRIGAFLPYTPLHHLLLTELPFPVVATSGNLSGEPIVRDEEEALPKLGRIADCILGYNRRIERRCDDSVVKVVGGVPTVLRRSRGYVPLPVELPLTLKRRVLAVGAHLKNTFALGRGREVFLSQHIGDMETLRTCEVFEESLFDLMELLGFDPEVVVCDLHPRYETTRWAEEFARRRGLPLIRVQHHHAHVLSCMAENGVRGRVLGVAWDGTGYGEDGTVWGGEFLLSDYGGYVRLKHFREFRLIGGEKAVREPARVALSLLLHIFGKEKLPPLNLGFSDRELDLLSEAWEKGLNAPLCSSAGRLLEGVSALLGVCRRNTYEGEAAVLLEDLYDPAFKDHYPFSVGDATVDWEPVILALLEEKDPVRGATRFLNTLARIVLAVAEEAGLERLCLSGGVMQNNPLVTAIRDLLEGRGFRVYTHRHVPPNDGGISLGQVARTLGEDSEL